MSNTEQFVSAYDRRIQLVREVIEDHTRLGKAEVTDLATRILSVIDHIPERIR